MFFILNNKLFPPIYLTGRNQVFFPFFFYVSWRRLIDIHYKLKRQKIKSMSSSNKAIGAI